MINLFYLSPNPYGGWVTFTAHLYKALSMVHDEVNLYKIGNNTERKCRPFGYDIEYRNIAVEDALKLDGVNLITAVGKRFLEPATALLKNEAEIVIHDPTELWDEIKDLVHSPIVIRPNNKKYFRSATYIPHPYVRSYDNTMSKRWPKGKACSTSRIDFDKHTEILLDANRIEKLIDIYGFENRLYTKFKIMPNYPEWEQSKVKYPREFNYAVNLLRQYKYMVDMSEIKGDGGGSQYTFLEAMDAGTACILNKAWFNVKGEMKDGVNCLSASSGEELIKIIKRTPAAVRNNIVLEGYKTLKKHDPKKIGRQYLKELWL